MHTYEPTAGLPWRSAQAILLVVSLLIVAAPAHAQSDYVDPYRFWKWPAKDAAALGEALLTKGLLFTAGGSIVLFTAGPHDPLVTEELSSLPPAPADLLVRIVEEFGNVRAVRPVAGAIFLGSLISDNRRLQDAAFTSLESIIYANLITSGLKSVFGRARPWQKRGAMEFDPFSGNTSFPSGHSTTAFAFVSPWLLYYPNTFTPGLLLLSTGTAFSRMLTQNHWFTDVVAGSSIGFVTAYVLTRRHQESRRMQVAPALGMGRMGLTLTVTLD